MNHNWEKIKNKIYYCDGSLRDIYIFNTDESDWEKFVNHVNNKYKIQWYNAVDEVEVDKIDFSVIRELLAGNSNVVSAAKVFLDAIQINVHFFIDAEIENDIDPSEFNSLDDHRKLIQYMIELSNLLNKQVVLSPENCPERQLIRVDRGVVLYTG